jgi:hypothetical protein
MEIIEQTINIIGKSHLSLILKYYIHGAFLQTEDIVKNSKLSCPLRTQDAELGDEQEKKFTKVSCYVHRGTTTRC